MSETQALVSFHIVGDAFVDLMCFLEHGLPMAGGDSLLSRPIETMAGGSAVNTATHLKFLVQNFFELQQAHHDELRHVWLHTSVNPEDDYGKLLLQHALKYNFPLINCKRHESECATGHCIVIVSNQERSFMTHPGCMHDLQATDLNLKSLVEAPSNIVLHDHHSHIHIAGYYNIPGFWNGKLQDVLERVRTERTKLPCRTTTTTISLVPQHDATCEWDGGLLNLLPVLDFLIMNQVEADSITRRQQLCEAQDDAVGHWASFFALKSPTTWIIVTRGALGAVSLRNGAVIASQAAKRVQVVDPTGAGDAFAAGFLHGLCNWRQQQAASESTRSWPVEAIQQGLYWGCSVASCSVLTRGASVPAPVEKIQEFLNKK